MSEASLLEILVPRDGLKKLQVEYLWHDEKDVKATNQWKKVVFHCRKGGFLSGALPLGARKDLLIGHIHSAHKEDFEEKRSWEDISEDNVFKNRGGIKAIQWVFVSEYAMQELEKCADKVRIHQITGQVTKELGVGKPRIDRMKCQVQSQPITESLSTRETAGVVVGPGLVVALLCGGLLGIGVATKRSARVFRQRRR
jgi:hypothetical protein